MTLAMQLIETAKRTGDWKAFADAIPYARFLGVTIERVEGELLGMMRFSPHLVGNPTVPALHGGTTGALLECTAICQLLWESETVILPKTVSITVDYLRPAKLVDTYAKGVITRSGKRVANVRVEAWQEDRAKPVAVANAIFLVM